MRLSYIFFLTVFCFTNANSRSVNTPSYFVTYPLIINLLNHPPTGTNITTTILEDNTYAFSIINFGFNDPNDVPQNNFLAVKVTTLPASGVLKLSGVNVTPGQFINVSNITSGAFTFTPAANDNGTPYTSFSFQVQDDGGTANGGVDLDPIPNIFTFNVTAVNDAPSFMIGANQFVCKNASAQTIPNWCTNISDGDPEVVQIISFIVTNDNNALFTSQPAISVAGQLTYTPAANAIGTAIVSVKLTDNGGTSNGGINESPLQTATITLKPDSGWSGNISTDWFTAGNWCSAVPTASTVATIYPATFQPVITGAFAICSHLTMMPSTTLNILAPQVLHVTGN